MAQGEFICHDREEPDPGNPIPELPDLFEQVWHRATRLLRELLGITGVRRLLEIAASLTGGGDRREGEFEEDLPPGPGLPDLCGEYNLPDLNYFDEEESTPSGDQKASDGLDAKDSGGELESER